ncbi:unnamed protein product [Phytophthora fragariaefolia]|uniref:Unnamed protein product n=1 Tax=Phytophthora fragariaefolia TaxID=1490495 RepID=A0A9W7DBI7_9STRA|nr:unnamed protein product [Phytophthora fragariaefolia]
MESSYKKLALSSVPMIGSNDYTSGFTLTTTEPIATLDYDYEVAGLPYFVVSAVSNGPVDVEVKYSEQFAVLSTIFRMAPRSQRWQTLRLLSGDSVTFEAVGLQASIEVIDDLSSLPGTFSSSNTKYNEIWDLGARAMSAACLDAGSQISSWNASKENGAFVPGTRPGVSYKAWNLTDYTLEFETQIIRGGVGFYIGYDITANRGSIMFHLSSEYPTNTTFVNTNTTLFPANTVTMAYGFDFVNASTMTSYPMGNYEVPFNVKEGVWYAVKFVVNSTAGNLVLWLDDQHVLDVTIADFGYTDSQLTLNGYTTNGGGAIGFGGWQDQASFIRNVVATSLGDSPNVLYSNSMSDESVVLSEFGVQSNTYGACLDGAKRDRYIWLGDFYHTTRIMGVANSKPEQITGTWEYLFNYQGSNGQYPGLMVMTYETPMPTPEVFMFDAGTGNAYLNFPDYDILGIGFVSYMEYFNDVDFARANWESLRSATAWLVSCQESHGLIDVNKYVDAYVFLGSSAGTAVNAAAVQCLKGMTKVAEAVGDEESANQWADAAATVKAAINELLWKDTLGNYAVDVSTPESLAGLRQGPGYLDTSATANSTNISPNTNGFLLDALLQTGQTDEAVFLLDNLWHAMISNESYRSGASWEYVSQSLTPGLEEFTSLSHPWGGAPTYALTNYVAGIRPAKFGFRQWIVNPLVTGLDLTSASATVKTPFGPITAAWDLADRQLSVTITAPLGTEGAFQVTQLNSSTYQQSLNGTGTPISLTVQLDAAENISKEKKKFVENTPSTCSHVSKSSASISYPPSRRVASRMPGAAPDARETRGPEPKRRRTGDAGAKPPNRKRFLRFLKSHELKFGLAPVARDEATGEVTLVVCRFCQHFGREQRPDKQRRSSKNVKYFRNSFRTDQYQQHHELSHGDAWGRYQACSDEQKKSFFPLPEGATPETPVQPAAPPQRLKVELAPGEVWALEPTREERQRCFELAPAIVELVAVMAIGATEPTVLNVVEKQSHHLMQHAHEPTSSAVARWTPPNDTFQSCTLVGTVVDPLYRVVAFSRSQIDCLVELAAAGLSFRQISSAMSSLRSHAPVLLRDVVNSHGAGSDAAAAANKHLHGAQNASPEYNEEQTAEFVRLIIAASLSVTARLLRGCWAFSLVLKASMEHTPVRSYLEFRVKVYGGGVIHNVHLLSIPCFEGKCKMMMYSTLERVLSVVLPNWRRRLIGVATDGDAQMPARVLDMVARLQQEAVSPVVYRSSSGCHQLDCIVTNFYSSLQGGCFLLVLKELSAYIRRQPELLAKMGAPPTAPSTSGSSKERWVALGKETNWIAAHREMVFEHLEIEKPPSAPDRTWWLFFATVNWVATRANMTFAKLLRNHATIADQIEAVAALSREFATSFHALGPLDDPLLANAVHDKMYKSRKGRFALGKPAMLTYIKEIDSLSVDIINSSEDPMVDLAVENMSICGVNMIESLLELSASLRDEENNGARRGPNNPKVSEFLPPTLPHELAQLSGREFASLLQTYGSIVRNFLSDEDIDIMDQELQGLRRGAVRESVLSAALANCNAETRFEDAWALTESRFKLLECFAGGFASVFSCDPIATQGGTSDLPLCRSEMDTARVLLADFALEGSLHAQQFPALMELNEKLDAEASRLNRAANSNTTAVISPLHPSTDLQANSFNYYMYSSNQLKSDKRTQNPAPHHSHTNRLHAGLARHHGGRTLRGSRDASDRRHDAQVNYYGYFYFTVQDVDIVSIPMHPDVPDTTCVAVFDGHGGPSVSMYIAEKIVGAITATEAFKKDHKSPESLAVALCEGFMAADEMLKEDPEFATSSDEVGSTGLFAIVTPKDIVCANVGDSRCIMSNGKVPEVLQLSVDHKPDLEFEKQRIVAAGGTVFRGRVCGGVAVSRSFGDLWFKRNADLKPHQQLVTSEPCVRVQRRDPADEFLVLCCDGIYDVMSNDQLRKFIRSKIKNGVKNPKEIAENLLDECLAKGSRDNMSAVIVLFDAALKK